MAASPMPPPQKSSSNVIWWVLGIIGACITLVIIAGLVVISVLVHRVKVNTRDNKVEIQTRSATSASIRTASTPPDCRSIPARRWKNRRV